jgi:hypothetical protein
MIQTKPFKSSYTINLAIQNNSLRELRSIHEAIGIGDMTQSNLDYHIRSWRDSNGSNKHWWKLRIRLLTAIVNHIHFSTLRNLPCVTQQLEEVN